MMAGRAGERRSATRGKVGERRTDDGNQVFAAEESR
jgi:hypothetical protein